MAVGFNYNITLSPNGKITDYQKAYNDNNSKIITVFFPTWINDNGCCTSTLYVGVNNTFPKEIKKVEGYKDDNNLNCYVFDVTVLYETCGANNSLGLARAELINPNECYKFESESFSI